ncbi:MAG TPA: hypothetical protein VGF91_31530 [Solirubrobacteraceae bacterium]
MRNLRDAPAAVDELEAHLRAAEAPVRQKPDAPNGIPAVLANFADRDLVK